MATKRATPFQRAHALQYAVRVTQRSTSNESNASVVIACECLFCVYFGRESKIGSKRKATSYVKYFKKPFRADNYTQHHTLQHPEKWKQYQEASEEEKKNFFDDVKPVKQTLHGHFGAQQACWRFLINTDIVNTIIGDMLWDPEVVDGETHANMLRPFQDFADATEELEEGEKVEIVIKNVVQFSLAIGYLKVSCSFRQASRVMTTTKETTGLAAIGSCNDTTIAKYARFALAINLQKISDLLKKSMDVCGCIGYVHSFRNVVP